MMSHFCSRSGLGWGKQVVACLAAFTMVVAVTPCVAQGTGVAPGRDSSVVVPPDSARADSSRADSTRADSAAPTPGGGTGPPAPPASPPAPVDSALGAACRDAGGGVPNLLAVTFRPSATESERTAVAQEVGGTLIGTSAPGSWYLQAPGAADRSVADRLIVMSPVLEVESIRCPS
jgi:hypothetical protein